MKSFPNQYDMAAVALRRVMPKWRKPLWMAAVLSWTFLTAHGEEAGVSSDVSELQDLVAQLESGLETALASAGDKQSGLNGKYRSALQKNMELSGQSGSADGVIAFRKALESFDLALENGGDPAELLSSDTEPKLESLTRMQQIFVVETTKIQVEKQKETIEIYDTFFKKLDALEVSLAKAGRLDDVVTARAVKERFARAFGEIRKVRVEAATAGSEERSGRLRVHGNLAEGVSAGHDSLQQQGDGFVAVNAYRGGWLATRQDGSSVAYSRDMQERIKLETHWKPTMVASGFDFWLLDDHRKVVRMASGNWWEPTLAAPVALAGADAIGLLVNAEGQAQIWSPGGVGMPALSLLFDTHRMVATRRAFLIINSEGKGRIWNAREGREIEAGDFLASRILDADGGEDHFVILTDQGEVKTFDMSNNISTSTHVPRDAKHATRVKADGSMSAALTADGWRAWGADDALARHVRRISDAIDMDLFSGYGTSFAIWVEPVR